MQTFPSQHAGCFSYSLRTSPVADMSFAQVNAAVPPAAHKSVDEIAMGFVMVANEAMCRPIRALTQMKVIFFLKHVAAVFLGLVHLVKPRDLSR